jgi:hypothetical protein
MSMVPGVIQLVWMTSGTTLFWHVFTKIRYNLINE